MNRKGTFLAILTGGLLASSFSAAERMTKYDREEFKEAAQPAQEAVEEAAPALVDLAEANKGCPTSLSAESFKPEQMNAFKTGLLFPSADQRQNWVCGEAVWRVAAEIGLISPTESSRYTVRGEREQGPSAWDSRPLDWQLRALETLDEEVIPAVRRRVDRALEAGKRLNDGFKHYDAAPDAAGEAVLRKAFLSYNAKVRAAGVLADQFLNRREGLKLSAAEKDVFGDLRVGHSALRDQVAEGKVVDGKEMAAIKQVVSVFDARGAALAAQRAELVARFAALNMKSPGIKKAIDELGARELGAKELEKAMQER